MRVRKTAIRENEVAEEGQLEKSCRTLTSVYCCNECIQNIANTSMHFATIVKCCSITAPNDTKLGRHISHSSIACQNFGCNHSVLSFGSETLCCGFVHG